MPRLFLFLLCLSLLSSCRGRPELEELPPPRPTSPAVLSLREAAKALAARPEIADDQIEVQHLLIAFRGSGAGGATRLLDGAERLAAELYARATAGEDFDSLVKAHTDDQHPGIYQLTQSGAPNHAGGLFLRSEMVPAFGDVGFRLAVGEIGIAEFHPEKSPYGYHIIKRLK